MPREVKTLLLTDIVGSTDRLRDLGDAAWAELLRRHHAIIRAALAAHGGREVDTAGDGFLACFDAPAPAVRAAAIAVAGVGALDLQIRAGLHTGEVELSGAGLSGVGVHLAARVMAQAEAGQVVVSATVRELMAGSGLRFVDLGVRELKGFSEGWRLFAVDLATVDGDAVRSERGEANGKPGEDVDLGAPSGGDAAAAPLTRPTPPSGVVTFLMTDIVGSTRLWEHDERTMRHALVRHDALMAKAVETHRGYLLRERGEDDSTLSVFARATDGMAAAVSAQLALGEEPWPVDCAIRVRMALHTGEASERDGDYYGRPVNRVARLRGIASGGQILVSKSTAEIVVDHLPEHLSLVELGLQLLKDMERPEMVYVLTHPSLEDHILEVAPPAPELDQQPVAEATAVPVADVPDRREVVPDETAPGTWEAVVSVDAAHFARTDREGLRFPESRAQRTFTLALPRVLIGRRNQAQGISPSIDLSGDLEDTGASRVQAILERQPDGSYALIDPGSTNGTFLNDGTEPVPTSVPVRLNPGDRVYVGAWTRIMIVTR